MHCKFTGLSFFLISLLSIDALNAAAVLVGDVHERAPVAAAAAVIPVAAGGAVAAVVLERALIMPTAKVVVRTGPQGEAFDKMTEEELLKAGVIAQLARGNPNAQTYARIYFSEAMYRFWSSRAALSIARIHHARAKTADGEASDRNVAIMHFILRTHLHS